MKLRTFVAIVFGLFCLFFVLRRDRSDDGIERIKCANGEKGLVYRPLGRVGTQLVRMKGIPFDSDLQQYIAGLEDLHSNISYKSSNDPIGELKIVTYSSSNHYHEAKMMVYQWRKEYPKIPIVFYSLGLQEKEKAELLEVCNLQIKDFDFNKYPPHVKKLKEYAFKAAVLQEVYREFEFFFFMDASLKPFNDSAFKKFLHASWNGEISPFSLTHPTPFSNTEMTHFTTYAYLPTQRLISDRPQFGSGSILVKRSNLSTEIIKWAVLCAMTKECISPTGSYLSCPYKKRIWGCHRYDQSVMHILLNNALQEYPEWEEKVLHWAHDQANVKKFTELKTEFPSDVSCKT